jgi:hypothetical protein
MIVEIAMIPGVPVMVRPVIVDKVMKPGTKILLVMT